MRRSDKDKQASEYLQNSDSANLGHDEEYLHSTQVITNPTMVPSLCSCFQGYVSFQMSGANAAHQAGIQCGRVAARATSHRSEDVDNGPRNRHLLLLSRDDQSVRLMSSRYQQLCAGQSFEAIVLEHKTESV